MTCTFLPSGDNVLSGGVDRALAGSDDTAQGFCDSLQPRGDIYRIANGGVFHALRGADVSHDDLAGVYSNANMKFRKTAIDKALCHPQIDVMSNTLEGNRCVNRPKRMICLSHRGAELDHDGVADKLVDAASLGQQGMQAFSK